MLLRRQFSIGRRSIEIGITFKCFNNSDTLTASRSSCPKRKSEIHGFLQVRTKWKNHRLAASQSTVPPLRSSLDFCDAMCTGRIAILVAVESSGILKGKQKLGVTFNFDKQDVIDLTKFTKMTMCRASEANSEKWS